MSFARVASNLPTCSAADTVLPEGEVVYLYRELPDLDTVLARPQAAPVPREPGVLYALVGAVLGEPTLSGPSLASIVVLVAAVNALLAPLAARALSWARSDDRDRSQTFFAR